MLKLERRRVAPPTALSRYKHGRDNWEDVAPADKQEVRQQLLEMQAYRCAYCEGSLCPSHHIEHFAPRGRFPDLTFDWTNLFLSCDSRDHCGHYKDRSGAQPYSPQHLIKPDQENPDHYLRFYSSGEIHSRKDLSPAKETKAAETLRVLHLNSTDLKAKRRRTLKMYKQMFEGLDPAEWRAYIEQELQAAANTPYFTIVRHFLEQPS